MSKRRERAARPMQDLHLTGRRGGRLQVGERRESDPTERASNADRAYFLAHPAATTYLREAVPGEFGEPSTSALLAGLGLGAIVLRQETVLRLEGGFTVNATGDGAANQAAAGQISQASADTITATIFRDLAMLNLRRST